MDAKTKGFRDAIHVPFVMVTCDTALQPGDKCSLRGEGDICVKWGGLRESIESPWHGVADPWSELDIMPGELFPLYIRKECFSELRHDFHLEIDYSGGSDTCHQVCNIVR